MMRILIRDLNLSLRADRILTSCGIRFLDEICNYNKREILMWRGMGKLTFQEIERHILEAGLTLREGNQIKWEMISDIQKSFIMNHLKSYFKDADLKVCFETLGDIIGDLKSRIEKKG